MGENPLEALFASAVAQMIMVKKMSRTLGTFGKLHPPNCKTRATIPSARWVKHVMPSSRLDRMNSN
jgi:hypothetical protein